LAHAESAAGAVAILYDTGLHVRSRAGAVCHILRHWANGKSP